MLRVGTGLVCALALLLGACGDGDGDGGEGGGGDLGADLTVTVRPAGADGAERTRRIQCEQLGAGAPEPACRRLARLTAEQLAPVAKRVACTQIYGGPATAHVEGEIRGQPVDARFERTDGCQIKRWDRNRTLLGEASGGPGA